MSAGRESSLSRRWRRRAEKATGVRAAWSEELGSLSIAEVERYTDAARLREYYRDLIELALIESAYQGGDDETRGSLGARRMVVARRLRQLEERGA